MSLTGRGAGLLAVAPALLAAAFTFGYPELAVLGAAALAALAFAFGYVLWRPRLTVRRTADPDRVTRGEASTVTLTVRNGSRLRVATVVAQDRCGDASVPVPLVGLRPGGEAAVSYPVPTDRRGVVAIGPLRVERRDPLGLLVSTRTYGDCDRVWVHPRAHHLGPVPVGVVRSLDGRVDRVPHGSITFDTLREYVVGDELRHVHWRTTARIGELMVREHVDTSLPRLVVLLDDRVEAHPGGTVAGTADSFEAACEAAASVVLAAGREDLPLALRLVSGTGVGGDGRRMGASAAARQYLDVLAEATLCPGGGLDTATARLRHGRIGDTLIYLTGPGHAEDIGLVNGLRGSYPSIVVGALGTQRAPAALDGVLVLAAPDGADFARAWDGVRAW